MNIAVAANPLDPLHTTKDPRAFIATGEPVGNFKERDGEVEIIFLDSVTRCGYECDIHMTSAGDVIAVVDVVWINDTPIRVFRCHDHEIVNERITGERLYSTMMDQAACVARELEQNKIHRLDETAAEKLAE